MWYSLPLLSFFLIWGHYTDKWRCLFSVIICVRSCNSFISPVIFTLQLDTIISFGEELVQRNTGEYFVFKIDWVHNERNQYMKVELQLKTSVIILNLKMKFKPHNSIGSKVSYIKELFIPCCMKIWKRNNQFCEKRFYHEGDKQCNRFHVCDVMYIVQVYLRLERNWRLNHKCCCCCYCFLWWWYWEDDDDEACVIIYGFRTQKLLHVFGKICGNLNFN